MACATYPCVRGALGSQSHALAGVCAVPVPELEEPEPEPEPEQALVRLFLHVHRHISVL